MLIFVHFGFIFAAHSFFLTTEKFVMFPICVGTNGFFRMSSRERGRGNQTFFRGKSSWFISNGIFSNSMHMLGYIPSFHILLQNDHNQFSNCAQLTSREKEYSNFDREIKPLSSLFIAIYFEYYNFLIGSWACACTCFRVWMCVYKSVSMC